VLLAPFGDHRGDAAGPDQAPVLVVVVASVREQGVGPFPRPADNASDRWDLVEQRQQLSDVVAVSARQRHREQDAPPVGEEVVLTARSCAVDRAGTAFGPRRAALTWEESITAPDQSSLFAAGSFFSSTRCSSSHTPASFFSFGPGSGSTGSISDHSSSDTIHGRDCLFPTTRPTTRQADSYPMHGFC
jgi:hypothetical protein